MKAFEQAAADPEWLSLRDAIILTQGRIHQLLERLDPDEVPDSKLFTELTELVGKQKERHARMAKDLHQMVTIERVLAIMGRLGTLVREHVTDIGPCGPFRRGWRR